MTQHPDNHHSSISWIPIFTQIISTILMAIAWLVSELITLRLGNKKRKSGRRLLTCLLLIFCFLVSYLVPLREQDSRVLAQVTYPCATPGKDGPGGTLTSIINTYYPGSANASAGAKSISVGTTTPSGNTAIASGDLLLVIQMQDATINSENNDRYGDNTSGDVPNITNPQPSTGASGWIATTAGTYEFVVATSAVSGGAVAITGGGTNNGLVNSYVNAAATSTKGKSTYQVIRVPQYSSATLGNATAFPWNGSIGGILAYDVAGNLNLTGTVDVSRRGFRGGGGRQLGGGGGNNIDFRTNATVNNNGAKGEGIAGTPRYVLSTFNTSGNSVSPALLNTTVEGYPNGSNGRGAPGNAGGGSTDGNPGSNDQNSGGGGGSNGGRGGRGGRSWSSQVTTGGFGGKEFPASTTRLILGGGGGAGTTNNSSTYPPANDTGTNSGLNSSGVAGGGMVMIRTNTVSGTGTINATGATALDVTRDGGGGGGAGGTVFITTKTGSLAGLTVNVKGGKGGNAVFNEAHGPGGGGGGGVIVTNASPNSVTVAAGGLDGGDSGRTGSTMALPFDSEAGTGLVVPIVAGVVPGVASGAECSAQLTVAKTTSTPSIYNLPAGTTATYTITVSNAANKAAATQVVISDTLPSGFTYASNSAPVLTGGATRTSVSNPTAGSTSPSWGTFSIPASGSVQITFVANVPNTVAAGQYQNTATATYLDPQRTTTTGTTNATYSATSSTSEDVTVVGQPKLLLVKRITRINTQDINDLIDGRSDVAVTASNYVAPAYAADDNAPKWPSNYLRGAIKTNVIPQDELEYTIYFLSNGDNSSNNVKICDLIPSNTTFIPTAFNGQTPNDGGLAGADQGIALAIGSTTPTVYLSNIQDSSDRGRYYSANDSSTPSFCGSNSNGAVVVNVTRSPDLANLPQATGTGTPSNSYGFVRFRAKVN